MSRRQNLIVLAGCFTAISRHVAAYTWPDYQIDLLGGYLYEQSGHLANSLAPGVFPCDTLIVSTVDTGRADSAEWLRTAYHDMATANVEAGTGGIDASIGFETDRPENVGSAFNGSLSFFLVFQSVRSSMSDLIAMGALTAVESCSKGAVRLSYRGGRIDATGPGLAGVPKPEEDLNSHVSSFKKQGFNATEMIGLVACGHTLGGVHGKDFPEIVPVLQDPVSSLGHLNGK
jgi:Peroxidase